MAKTLNVQREAQCWVILYKEAKHPEYTVFDDVYLAERDATKVARELAKAYAKDSQQKVTYATVGYEFTAKVGPLAIWRVQAKHVILPSGK